MAKKKVAQKRTARAPSKGSKKLNREQWLNKANLTIAKWFDKIGYPLTEKKLRISCGFPAGRGSSKFVAQTWDPRASKDGTIEIFISPTEDDSLSVLDHLVHEDVHAAVGNKAGHKGAFALAARAIGLEGKLTATTAGEGLKSKLKTLLKTLPPYPHASLDQSQRPIKKQPTKLLKSVCAECGYLVRVTAKWVNEVGAPHCPEHGEMNVIGLGE